MKIIIETADTPDDEHQFAEILKAISEQIIIGDITDKEQMDGSYRFETELGAAFLYTEDQ